MVANVVVGMLCGYLLCFAVMFWAISTRLPGNKLGMDVLALGNAMLGASYVLQLLGGGPQWNVLSVINHTLSLCVPLVYVIGVRRYFGGSPQLLKPLILLALAYTLAQMLAQELGGSVVRFAMLSLVSALLFTGMTVAAALIMRTVAKHMRVEMVIFAVFIAGMAVLNALKFLMIFEGGLEALNLAKGFHTVFYIYMSSLATVLAPMVIWLVLRQLTDELRATASRDPLTQLLNRRGLLAGMETYFQSRLAKPARLLMLDLDHFKAVNDTYGHKAGDTVLCHLAGVLRQSLRRGDLASRMGGEEFVVVCFEADEAGVQHLANRLRQAIEQQTVSVPGHKALRCTVTIGISLPFHSVQGFDTAMQEADAALYRGKLAGRNRIEWGSRGVHAPAAAPLGPQPHPA